MDISILTLVLFFFFFYPRMSKFVVLWTRWMPSPHLLASVELLLSVILSLPLCLMVWPSSIFNQFSLGEEKVETVQIYKDFFYPAQSLCHLNSLTLIFVLFLKSSRIVLFIYSPPAHRVENAACNELLCCFLGDAFLFRRYYLQHKGETTE